MAQDQQVHDQRTGQRADVSPRVIFDDTGIRRALTRIAHEILERNEDPESLYLIAIPNGGVPLARQLAANLKEIAGRWIRTEFWARDSRPTERRC